MHTKGLTARRQPWRLRYSLRTHFAVLSVICVYLASWQITGTHGIARVAEATGRRGESPVPFIVAVEFSDNVDVTRRYYTWFMGRITRLPFQRQFSEPNPMLLGGTQPRIIIQPEDEMDLRIAGR